MRKDAINFGRDEMGQDAAGLLKWMLECADARNSDPSARTVNLKFSRATLEMWQNRARDALGLEG